ncbi:MAG: hypothetical protein ACUVXA_09005 [Candidatus Jordarchaeum sp.]|uniref:hypothetical protein n=1 Tax=Candidatus Jordarchaeum sp. TaxID=2823881 RepID=UPI00404B1730
MVNDKDKGKDCEVCAPKLKETGEIEEYDFEELKKLSIKEPKELSIEELKDLTQKEKFGKKNR